MVVLLARVLRYRLHIVGEVSVDVRHCLMALPGVAKHELRRVQSHPQASPSSAQPLPHLQACADRETGCPWLIAARAALRAGPMTAAPSPLC